MDQTPLSKIQEYSKYFLETNSIQELEHVDDEFFTMVAET
jgi:hypothetical protein